MGAFNYCMNLKTMFIPKNVIIGPQILSVSRELIIYSEESSMPLNLWDELWAKQGMGYSKIIWNTTESEYDNKIIGDIN